MSEREMRVSERELHCPQVVRLTLEGRKVWGRGKIFGVSVRQMKGLRRKIRERGAQGLLQSNRGKPAWNKTGTEKLKVWNWHGTLPGLNDTHLIEKLKEKEKFDLSRPAGWRVFRHKPRTR
jgi:hypothetical protein